jgi:hypothetical protein
MGGGFTKLASPGDYPGTVTKIHTGTRMLKVGDIIGVEWMHNQPLLGHDVQGEIEALDFYERDGKFGRELVYKVTLKAGWYSQGIDPYMTPAFPDDPEEGDMAVNIRRVTNATNFPNTWELGTSDNPGWHCYILGGSDERLVEIADMLGKSVEELTAGRS